MNARESLLPFTVSAILIITSCAEHSAVRPGTIRSAHMQKGSIPLGVRVLTVHGVCGTFDASASSGDFFEQLRRRDEPGGSTFRLRGKVVSTFPDQTVVTI